MKRQCNVSNVIQIVLRVMDLQEIIVQVAIKEHLELEDHAFAKMDIMI